MVMSATLAGINSSHGYFSVHIALWSVVEQRRHLTSLWMAVLAETGQIWLLGKITHTQNIRYFIRTIRLSGMEGFWYSQATTKCQLIWLHCRFVTSFCFWKSEYSSMEVARSALLKEHPLSLYNNLLLGPLNRNRVAAEIVWLIAPEQFYSSSIFLIALSVMIDLWLAPIMGTNNFTLWDRSEGFYYLFSSAV